MKKTAEMAKTLLVRTYEIMDEKLSKQQALQREKAIAEEAKKRRPITPPNIAHAKSSLASQVYAKRTETRVERQKVRSAVHTTTLSPR